MITLVYDEGYNIPSLGILGEKYARVFSKLTEVPHISPTQCEITQSHTSEYLKSLEDPNTVRSILEYTDLTDDEVSEILAAMRLQYSGSLTATKKALETGFAINLGGGFHHASRNTGGGFCVYNDITACVDWLLHSGSAKRILIIDLDAHQGNGYEVDLQEECKKGQVCIFDAYDPLLYPFPFSEEAFESIHYFIPYAKEDRGDTFIPKLLEGIVLPFIEFQPDFVIYNAGTDTLEGDSLTGLNQTEEAILDRDSIVVETCRSVNIPIMMCLSGGYQPACSDVIVKSIRNLAYNLTKSSVVEKIETSK